MVRLRLSKLSVFGGFLFFANSVYADGIDLMPYLLRIHYRHSVAGIVGIIFLMMLANYVMNFLVIGLPAIRSSHVPKRTAALDLVLLTLLGQIADRIGAYLAMFVTMPFERFLIGIGLLRGMEGSWFIAMLILNLIFAGLAVGLLAVYFLRCRWKVPALNAWIIALAAAIFTNPAWAIWMGLLFH